MTSFCSCTCQPCPLDHRLCPTANICINNTQWCDGFVDCPDDETDCPTPSTPEIKTTTEKPVETKCPPVTCPEGFKVSITKQGKTNVKSASELHSTNDKATHHHSDLETTHELSEQVWLPFGSKSSKWGSLVNRRNPLRKFNVKTGHKSKHSSKKHHNYFIPTTSTAAPSLMNDLEYICPEFECLPIEETSKNASVCFTPKCPDGYDQVMLESKDTDCPKHNCVIKKLPEGNCHVVGRTFNTFDGSEFKYDVCDHILSRDVSRNKQWEVKLSLSCPYVGSCQRNLLIRNFNDTIILHANMTVSYNGYLYSIEQVEKIGSYNRKFAIVQISNKFIIFSSILEFNVVWESNGNVKLIIPGKLQRSVEGLCGNFDGNTENERLKPDGTIALTSVDFGDSWGTGDKCETKVCPLHIQNAAWEMCSAAKKPPLSDCDGAVNVDKFMSQCIESLCLCLESNTNNSLETINCRCEALLGFVTECRTAKPTVNLDNWRVANDCPVDCPAPFVYKECYNRICEIKCTDLLAEDACPASPDTCFPGCYCPDGFVRDSDNCIKPSQCRNCICDNFGKTRYITFDKNDFTFNSNCSFVLTETVPGFDGSNFKVLASGGMCDHSFETCIKAVTIMYDKNKLTIGNDKLTNEFSLHVNNEDFSTNKYPVQTTWFDADVDSNKRLIMKLPAANFELIFHGRDKGFSIRLPSHIYYDKVQGLCGNCNGDQMDDLKTSDGEVTDDIKTFGLSWLTKDLSKVSNMEEKCFGEPENEECKHPSAENDICIKLEDVELFGMCHIFVDPEPYVKDCYKGLCKGTTSICYMLETYARECQTAGICIAWREKYNHLCPYTCPKELEYRPCVPGCPQTCEEYSLDLCPSPPGEGCVCPDEKVLLNGTCVPKSRCTPCDSEGHYPGDEWHPDQCMTCTCENPGTINCRRSACSISVCELGQKSIIQAGTENDCCPKYICVPEPKLVCDEPQLPECGYGQELKVDTDETGCQQYLCVCIPKDRCDDISDELNVIREPGVRAVINETGCCPKVDLVCNKESCPTPPECSQFYQLLTTESSRCCPNYTCEPPKDRCLYEFEYGYREKGGPRKLLPNEKFLELKLPGDVWLDGPCHSCECQSSDLKSKCTTKSCQSMLESLVNDYVVEEHYVYGECCPTFKKVACKVGNNTLKAGEVWKTPEDNCKSVICKQTDSEDITIQEIVESCNTQCKQGWKYVEPTSGSPQCCGECKPSGCVVNGSVKDVNSIWFENNDNCTTYSCEIIDGQPQIEKSVPWCPTLDDCPVENIADDGCCKKCNLTAQESHTCFPEEVNTNETLHLVQSVSTEHGVCENKESIRHFTSCRGGCDSYTSYNQRTGHHDSKCRCCRPTSYTNIIVPMICEDGFFMEKYVSIPSKCSCESCEGPEYVGLGHLHLANENKSKHHIPAASVQDKTQNYGSQKKHEIWKFE